MLAMPPARTYATWSPTDKVASINLTESNLVTEGNGSGYGNVRSTIGPSAGKWYCEVEILALGSSICIGFAKASAPVSDYPYATADSAVYNNYGAIFSNTTNMGAVPTLVVGDILGLAFDLADQRLWWYRNNSLAFTGTVTNWTEIFPFAGTDKANSTWKTRTNFGASPFVYPPPAGHNPGVYV